MPATGPRAPARTLVAVRAMVPVTQMPPNSAEAMLATPCATSSQFERCRRPVMLSATTAESRLSIPPSRAKDRAAGSIVDHAAEREVGQPRRRQRARDAAEAACRWSPPAGRTPRRRASASVTAIRKAGQCGRQRRTARITPTVTGGDRDRGEIDAWAAPRPAPPSLGTSGPGSGAASVRPSSSLSWLAKMMTAMPAVKPTVTG